MTSQPLQKPVLSGGFNQASGVTPATDKKKPLAPFSIRLSAEERAYLEQRAGNQPLGAYIRGQILGDKAQKRRAIRKPSMGDTQYAALLAALGESRLSSNLNQLAHHANCGTLETSEELEQQLVEAYKAVLEMRKALFMALGLKSGDQS